MTYYTGAVVAVPTVRKQEYITHAQTSWPLFNSYGATRMVETWGTDVPRGTVTDFYGAVNAKDDETIVFSWIEWPDKATADAAWEKMQSDPAVQHMPKIPFDGSRMIFGGFEPIMTSGSDQGSYYQGFILAVPETNRTAYEKMAVDAWEGLFRKHGCLGIFENWGLDIPHGQQTDFWRAAKARDGEVPVFSWSVWPDKTTCDIAAKAMETEMAGQEFPEMPFDGMRMMWGGFDLVFDSGKSES
ncbi:MAG: DUF1428 domain-containing protein [Paracoccus sp. (in: a-proteobacteria)]